MNRDTTRSRTHSRRSSLSSYLHLWLKRLWSHYQGVCFVLILVFWSINLLLLRQLSSLSTTSIVAPRPTFTVPMSEKESRNLLIATRLHLGNATSPPDSEKLDKTVKNFLQFCTNCNASHSAIAVDATPKVPGYDYVQAVKSSAHAASFSMEESHPPLQVIPVTPWGKFVPALNALIRYAAVDCTAQLILFVSAETDASASSVSMLVNEVDSSTLVVGAVLPGHDYHPGERVPINGRNTPWNTLAVWNVPNLALNGFPLVSDGVHLNKDGSEGASGVEEASAIAMIQNLLGEEEAKAKLMQLPDVSWDQQFEDEERQKWHEKKMQSKVERAARHLELTGLSGWVQHL